MSYGDLAYLSQAEQMDLILDTSRAHHEQFRGERYWERPVATTGPKDPFPGHHWRCRTRDGGGERLCNCTALRDGDRLFGRSS